jgi:hypothetical protein
MVDESKLRGWLMADDAPARPEGPRAVVPSPGKRTARALSARELLSKLEGTERDELLRAMRSRDLDTVRAMLERHANRARFERESADRAELEAPNPMMKPRGWTGPKRPRRGGTNNAA